MIITKLGERLKNVPRGENGDPKFSQLEEVRGMFRESEIVELVNRALYQLEYQQNSHAKYQQKRRELERPVREAFKKLYPGESWMKATDEQIRASVEEVKKARQ